VDQRTSATVHIMSLGSSLTKLAKFTVRLIIFAVAVTIIREVIMRRNIRRYRNPGDI